MSLLIPPREREAAKQAYQEGVVREATRLSRGVEELRNQESSLKQRLQSFQETEFRKFSEAKEARQQELKRLEENVEAKKKELERALLPLKAKEKELHSLTIELATEKDNIRSFSAELTLKQQELQVLEGELERKRVLLTKEWNEVLSASRVLQKEREVWERFSTSQNGEIQSLTDSAKSMVEMAQKVKEEVLSRLRACQLKECELEAREKQLEERELRVVVEELKYYSPVKKSHDDARLAG